MGWDTDKAKEHAAAEDWELVGNVPGPYRCVLSQQTVPAGSYAIRIRGQTSGGELVVGRGVARDYFGVSSTRVDLLLARIEQN